MKSFKIWLRKLGLLKQNICGCLSVFSLSFFIVCHFIFFIFINNVSTFVKVARLDFLGSLLPHFERLLRPPVKKIAEKGYHSCAVKR